MSVEVQVGLIKKVLIDWANDDKADSIEALIAITEILDFDPHAQEVISD